MNLILAMLLMLTTAAHATSGAKAEPTAFEKLTTGHELYVEHKPAAAGQPTVVVLNGLTYSVRNWDRFTAQLATTPYGVLRYDMYGQGETLLHYGLPLAVITLAEQVEDLHQLLARLSIQAPVYILGLSYGGGLALAFQHRYPNEAKALILMAPFTEPVRAQEDWIRLQVTNTRVLFPFNAASDDELYDYYLRILVETTYPTAEPTVLDNPFKLEGVFRLVQGIRKFHALPSVRQMTAGSIHLIQAGSDQYIQSSVFEEFWSKLPPSVAASRIIIEGSEHKIPEAVPNFSAGWVEKILAGDKRLSAGRQFIGEPLLGQAQAGDIVVELPKEF